MAEKVKVIDRGWKRIQKNMKRYFGGSVAAVGIQGVEAEEIDEFVHGDATNVLIGVVHEFGWGNNPERSYLRSTFDEKLSKYKLESDKIARGIFGGGTAYGALLLLGEQFRGDIIRKIQSGISPGLKEKSLVGRPGSGTTPLWATGQLVNSITSVIKDRREVE
jgi:hypothetical protein